MKKEEISQILAVIRTAFTKQFEYPTGDSEMDRATETLWMEILGGFEFGRVKAAVLKYLHQPHDWPPKPGQIHEMLVTDDQPTADEMYDFALKIAPAWRLIKQAPQAVREYLEFIGKRQVEDMKFHDDYAVSAFKRGYKDFVETMRDRALSEKQGIEVYRHKRIGNSGPKQIGDVLEEGE